MNHESELSDYIVLLPTKIYRTKSFMMKLTFKSLTPWNIRKNPKINNEDGIS